jgi:hypothetical protein
MGDSGWDYIQAFEVDLSTTMDALRRRVFDEGDYFWFDEVPRPATLAELDALFTEEPDFEDPDFDLVIDITTSGTHSILDVRTMGGRFGIRPLTGAEAEALFGTATPHAQEFERADIGGFAADRRGAGYCVALHDALGNVEAVGFWGISGD